MESYMGPYNGYASMFKLGAELRGKYGHLWDEKSQPELPFFTASQERIVVTSVNVARGFLGAKWKNHAKFIVLNETRESGLNSITPVDGCPAFEPGYKGFYTSNYGKIGLSETLKRFKKDLPGVNATTDDIANLMSLCMYDLNVVGESPLCDYFTPNDWKAFEYMRDLDYYYYSGRGNPTVSAIGGVIANATLNILEQDADEQHKIYFTFSHETNILMYLTAVGLFNPHHDLDWKAIQVDHKWRTSQIVPMGTRVALERLSCGDKSKKFVRFIVNGAVIPHDKCTQGPGFSCPLNEYIKIQKSALEDPHITCNIGEDYLHPKNLTFYWDWKENPDRYRNWVVNLEDF